MIASLKENVSELFSNKRFLIILLIAGIFIAAAVYTYRKVLKPRMDNALIPNSEYLQDSNGTGSQSSESADLYYFYTEWCPHCKKARPIMNKLKEYLQGNNNQVNDIKVNMIEVDCETDSATAEKFGVEGYPTIKLVHQRKVIEYDAKPDLDILQQFLSSSLQ
jgi:thiol-disulfide isomerase/thioredoxin